MVQSGHACPRSLYGALARADFRALRRLGHQPPRAVVTHTQHVHGLSVCLHTCCYCITADVTIVSTTRSTQERSLLLLAPPCHLRACACVPVADCQTRAVVCCGQHMSQWVQAPLLLPALSFGIAVRHAPIL